MPLSLPLPSAVMSSIPLLRTQTSAVLLVADPFHPVGWPAQCARECNGRTHFVCHSATGHLLQVVGVPIPLHGDLQGGAFDLAQVVRRQVDGGGSDVLLEPLQ